MHIYATRILRVTVKMYDKNCGATHEDPKQTQTTKLKLILPYQQDNTKRPTIIW
jgi:hypothetical protein